MFFTIAGCLNSPLLNSPNTYYSGISFRVNEKWGSQLVLDAGGTRFYLRGQYDGTWSTWRTLF